ncbi:MAG: anhydro-N-acetylmuramic acid kinase [Micavibrio sp.]|nr:MAG: anhydro-N-acetylmuramic acid kinase [Micavibrio sp.]
MTARKVYTAIGLMSGTSLDGVDAAVIKTDGVDAQALEFVSVAYEEGLRDKLRACLGRYDRDAADMQEAARAMTQVHIEAVGRLEQAGGADVIGFHGQTTLHNPKESVTVQIGDAALLAHETGIDVVSDFRSADVAAGGQGAPFLPLYHQARAADMEKPVAIVNIGGVANVTWIGEGAEDIVAFDTGPGNALLDDFVRGRTGQDFDEGGALADSGHSVDYLLEKWYAHPYFKQKPPKSLDRNAWDVGDLSDLNDADGAATLSVFTAETIIAALDHMPQKPQAWYVTGGGRKNKMIMQYLKTHLKNVAPVEDLGWNGDALEAEGFAYLAVRSLLGLPLSVPGTTGVPAPLTGGVFTKCA